MANLFIQNVKWGFVIYSLLLFIINLKNGSALKCYCEGACPDDRYNGTCIAKPDSWCYYAKRQQYSPELGHSIVEHIYGCLPPEESGYMQCKGYLVNHHVPKNISCCKAKDYCNKFLQTELQLKPDPEIRDWWWAFSEPLYQKDELPGELLGFNDWNHLAALVVSVGVIVILLLMLTVYLYYRKLNCRRINKMLPDSQAEKLIKDSSLAQLMSQSSGSGSGLPNLVQSTIARQIELLQSIGKGRYGEVWKARWRHDYMAAKIFYTTEEISWQRETEIYKTVLIRHEHILGYIAADIRGTGSWTQLLLLTEFHERGSLHDELKRRVEGMTEQEVVRMALTSAIGLAHLHTESNGLSGKPAIAHRDLKTKNILVKKDGSCCIADFGLAVRYYSETGQMNPSPESSNPWVGTKRYMPPEVLDGTIDLCNFRSFTCGDMYSFGLVLWELATRCLVNGKLYQDYRIPFQDVVPSDPSYEDMRKVVCVDGQRPYISPNWQDSKVTSTLIRLMSACWCDGPLKRPTSVYVKKALAKIS